MLNRIGLVAVMLFLIALLWSDLTKAELVYEEDLAKAATPKSPPLVVYTAMEDDEEDVPADSIRMMTEDGPKWVRPTVLDADAEKKSNQCHCQLTADLDEESEEDAGFEQNSLEARVQARENLRNLIRLEIMEQDFTDERDSVNEGQGSARERGGL